MYSWSCSCVWVVLTATEMAINYALWIHVALKSLSFLQHVRFAHSADRCNNHGLSVRPSVRHVPVFCSDEWRYDCAVFSVSYLLLTVQCVQSWVHQAWTCDSRCRVSCDTNHWVSCKILSFCRSHQTDAWPRECNSSLAVCRIVYHESLLILFWTVQWANWIWFVHHNHTTCMQLFRKFCQF